MLLNGSRSHRSLIWITLLALVMVAGVLGILSISKFDGQITGLFRIGSVLPLSPYLQEDSVFIHADKVGNDGQQFLSIALDPFLRNPATLDSLDVPQYRYRRILYPWLGYLLGLGNPALIPFAMVGINLVCVAVIVYTVGRILQEAYGSGSLPEEHRDSAIMPTPPAAPPIGLALLILGIPSVWMILSLSTADLLSSCCLVVAVYSYWRDRPLATCVALGVGCLARETLLIGWLALVITAALDRDRRYLNTLPISLVPLGIWTFYVYTRFPSVEQTSSSFSIHFSYPLLGIVSKIGSFLQADLTLNTIFDLYLFILLIGALILTWVPSRILWAKAKWIVISSGFYAVLFLLTTMQILGHFVDYSRVFTDVYILLMLSLSLQITRAKVGWMIVAAVASLGYVYGFATEFG